MILSVEIFVFCFFTLGLGLLTFRPVNLVDVTGPLLDLLSFRFGLETLAAVRIDLPGLPLTTLFFATRFAVVSFRLVATFRAFAVFFAFLAIILSLNFGETLSRANEYVFKSFLSGHFKCQDRQR